MIEKEKKRSFSDAIIQWYERHGRCFSWRCSNYNLWQWVFLEVFLQRTKAETIEKYLPPILKKYKLPETVLSTKYDIFKEDIKPFGLYNKRGKALKIIAHKFVNSSIKPSYHDLIRLPNVGDYISNAVLCFGFNQRRALIDTNTSRVISRYFEIEHPLDYRDKQFKTYSETILPQSKWVQYNYGLIDIGATLCLRRNPKCESCPVETNCNYSSRSYNFSH